MSTNKRVLLFTSSLYDYVTSWSEKKDYQDGLNNIRIAYNLIGKSDEFIMNNIVYNWVENDMNCLLDLFERIQDVVITGSWGLWNGRQTIECVRKDNLKGAFWYCADDMDNVEVYDNNGVIEINAYHHDGCNEFSIYQLNSKGVNSGDRADLEKKTYHKKIKIYQW